MGLRGPKPGAHPSPKTEFKPGHTVLTGAGQPTLYRPEYDQMVVEHMTKGLSRSAFGGVVGVSVETVRKWYNAHPSFKEACDVGQAARLLRWEEENLTCGKDRAGTVQFTLKNVYAEEWKDRQEIDHDPTGSLESAISAFNKQKGGSST